MRQLPIPGVMLIVLLVACADDKSPDFAPPMDPKTIYSFKIVGTSGSGVLQYDLTGITQQATAAGTASWIFMLKGKAKTARADVYITGRVNANAYDSYLNIAIAQEGSSTFFYKDCNNFSCQATPGKDSQGNFVKINFNGSQCITNTLASERSMTITQFAAQLNPITFYIQED